MKRLGTLLLAVLSVGLMSASVAWAAGPRRAPGGPAGKAERFVVVQIGEDLEVMSTSELAARKKSINEQYKQDMAKYNQDKKEAAKRKEKFEGQKPVKLVPKQVGSSFKTREEAEAFCEKKKEKAGEKHDKKSGS